MITALVEQARWTGSARNRQPWRVVAVEDASVRAQLARLGAYAGHLADAPTVLAIASPSEPLRDTAFDLGRFTQSLTLAASDAGLGCCVVSLYPDDNARVAAELVGLSGDWVVNHAISIGYSEPLGVRPPGRRAIPAGRLPTSEILRFM